jgi:hypothetical protein
MDTATATATSPTKSGISAAAATVAATPTAAAAAADATATPDAVTPPTNGHASASGAESTPEVSPTPKMSRREEVALKAAAKKLQEEANLSFKPHLAHRKKKNGDPEISPTKPAEEATSRLYSDARKKQEEAKLALPKPDTFKPTIAHRPTSFSNEKKRTQSPMDSSNRLFRTSHRQTKPEEPQASFTPTISKRAKSVERNPGVSTSDRLYSQAVIVKEKQEKMREAARKQEQSILTFRPSINGSGRPGAAGVKAAPVSERMQAYIEARNKKIEDATREKEAREAAEFTGRPSIGTRRRDSKAAPSSGPSVFDRLTKIEAIAAAERDADETFKPTIFTSKRSQSVLILCH